MGEALRRRIEARVGRPFSAFDVAALAPVPDGPGKDALVAVAEATLLREA